MYRGRSPSPITVIIVIRPPEYQNTCDSPVTRLPGSVVDTPQSRSETPINPDGLNSHGDNEDERRPRGADDFDGPVSLSPEPWEPVNT